MHGARARVTTSRLLGELFFSVASAGAKAFTPKDLELFQASEAQQKSCFRGYDKITINKPAHGLLPPWKLGHEVFDRIGAKRI